jgi:hypothetical protein
MITTCATRKNNSKEKKEKKFALKKLSLSLLLW